MAIINLNYCIKSRRTENYNDYAIMLSYDWHLPPIVGIQLLSSPQKLTIVVFVHFKKYRVSCT